MSRDFPVTGLPDVMNMLSQLGPRIEQQAVRSGLTAAAAVVRDEARLNVPHVSGLTGRAIRSGSPRKNQDGSYSISVSLKGNDHAFIGLFIEKGVAPHLISLRPDLRPLGRKGKPASMGTVNKMVKRGSLKIGNAFVGAMIHHPGFAARPFLVPALDRKAEEAVMAFRNRIVAVVQNKTGFNMDADLQEAA